MRGRVLTLESLRAGFQGQSEPVDHAGWIVSDQETVFCWVPDLYLTMLVTLVFFWNYLLTR
jgi:hypothetical protein